VRRNSGELDGWGTVFGGGAKNSGCGCQLRRNREFLGKVDFGWAGFEAQGMEAGLPMVARRGTGERGRRPREASVTGRRSC